jgi:hypothetical protein
MPTRSSKQLPRDVNQRAKAIVDISTGEADEIQPARRPEKNEAAVALGRLGGLKGGKARAESLSPKRRSEIAAKAARSRWAKKSG